MAMYDLKSFEKYGASFRPTGGKDYKKAVKKGKDVVGKSGSSKAPEGYYQSGTTTLENMRGTPTTYSIYSKLPEQKSEKKKSKPKNKQKQKTQAKAAPVTEPTNQYQSQIDELQFECAPEHVGDLSTSLVYSATAAGEYYNMRIRIDAEATHGNNWSETH
jgi:hypothetical protein